FHYAVVLLEMLFPDGPDGSPRLTGRSRQGQAINSLSLHYRASGRPTRALSLMRRGTAIREELDAKAYLSTALANLSATLRLVGGIREAEAAARRAFLVGLKLDDKQRQSASLFNLGLVLAMRAMVSESDKALHRSLQLSLESPGYEPYDSLAMRALLFG